MPQQKGNDKALTSKHSSLEEKIMMALRLRDDVRPVLEMDEKDYFQSIDSPNSRVISLSSSSDSVHETVSTGAEQDFVKEEMSTVPVEVVTEKQKHSCVPEEEPPSEIHDETELDQDQEAACIRQLIGTTVRLLDDAEEDDSNYVERAIEALNMACSDAKRIGDQQLEAKALQAMATAFKMCKDRERAAPALFEMAADMFFSCKDFADSTSCIMSATQLYKSHGQLENAIQCCQRFVEHDRSGVMADHLVYLLLEWSTKSTACA